MATMALGRTWSLRWEFDFPKNRTPSRTLAALKDRCTVKAIGQSGLRMLPQRRVSKLARPSERALPLKINFYPIGQPSCKFRRDRMGGARFCLSA
jgi:hypothetical protein